MKKLHYLAPELIAQRMAEELKDGYAAQLDGQTTNPHRWAFVQMLRFRDDSGFRRGCKAYRFADAVIERMIAEWPELG